MLSSYKMIQILIYFLFIYLICFVMLAIIENKKAPIKRTTLSIYILDTFFTTTSL